MITTNLFSFQWSVNQAAGYPMYAEQRIEEMFPVDTRFVNLNGYSKDDFFYLRIKGNSMAPYILDNDLVLVRRQSIVDNNELAVVLCNSETATVKRVVFAGDKIILNSDNKEYHLKYIMPMNAAFLGEGVTSIWGGEIINGLDRKARE